MRQANNHPQKNYTPLRVVTEKITPHTNTGALISTAWNFACAALWNHTKFSGKEIAAAKEKIGAYLLSEDPDKTFLVFCQRVLLARHYIMKNPGRYIPLPTVWLDADNKSGFAGTQRWYEDVKNIRASVPAYKTGIKALAEAVLELSKDPSPNNYEYWRSYFIEHQAPGLLNLLQVSTVQQFYS